LTEVTQALNLFHTFFADRYSPKHFLQNSDGQWMLTRNSDSSSTCCQSSFQPFSQPVTAARKKLDVLFFSSLPCFWNEGSTQHSLCRTFASYLKLYELVVNGWTFNLYQVYPKYR
jgi:hypothetical protein